MNDNNNLLIICILAICLLFGLGVIAVCCGCGENCFVGQAQSPQQTIIVPATPAPVIEPAPLPTPAPAPTPTQEVVVVQQPVYSCDTVVTVSVFPSNRPVYLCRGEKLTVTITVTGRDWDPTLRIYLDGRLYRTVEMYYSYTFFHSGYLTPGSHTFSAISQIEGCTEGQDSATFYVGDCYNQSASCCCCPGCYPCISCPPPYRPPLPPAPPITPCPPGIPPPPLPGPTPQDDCPHCPSGTPPPPAPTSGGTVPSAPSGSVPSSPSGGGPSGRPN